MIDVNVLEDLVYHIKRSRHQMDLNLRTIRRTKKVKAQRAFESSARRLRNHAPKHRDLSVS